MAKKSSSSQTGTLKIGTKDDLLARKEKMLSSLPVFVEESEDNNCLKAFRILLSISSIMSLSLLGVSFIYITYFNSCVSMTFGPLIPLSTKVYFLLISLQNFILSIFGVCATKWHLKSNITLYVKSALLLLLISSLLIIWYLLHKKYDLNVNVVKSIDVCNQKQQECWDSLHSAFHCCGWESADNWKEVPSSCCNTSMDGHARGCENHYISKNFAYRRGCFNIIKEISQIMYLIASSLSLMILILFVSYAIVLFHYLVFSSKWIFQIADNKYNSGYMHY